MTQLEQRFSKLSKLAKSLDDQAMNFSEKTKKFAKDLEKKLNSRRKKYVIEVKIEEMFDFFLDIRLTSSSPQKMMIRFTTSARSISKKT